MKKSHVSIPADDYIIAASTLKTLSNEEKLVGMFNFEGIKTES